jgi:hypothetical protein
MNNLNLLNRQLERINIENFIWLVYFFLVGFNIYSNYLEKKYILDKDINAKQKFRKINENILLISLIIYMYFLFLNWQDLTNLKLTDSKKRIKLTTYSFIASILFVIGGLLTLYVAININTLDEDAEIGII